MLHKFSLKLAFLDYSAAFTCDAFEFSLSSACGPRGISISVSVITVVFSARFSNEHYKTFASGGHHQDEGEYSLRVVTLEDPVNSNGARKGVGSFNFDRAI